MEELIGRLRQLQANAFIYYSKAHGYHWDVEGILFDQFHSFFEGIYQDAWESVDDWAEWIRRFGGKASFNVSEALMISNVKYDLGPETSNPMAMLQSLYNSNAIIIEDLKQAFSVAEQANEEGAANFIAERIDVHQKWQWKIRASLMTTINS
jgi:starvation-inducible DNA-binding protein